jgi:hypothetical protein
MNDYQELLNPRTLGRSQRVMLLTREVCSHMHGNTWHDQAIHHVGSFMFCIFWFREAKW